jgi:hypothetical protein
MRLIKPAKAEGLTRAGLTGLTGGCIASQCTPDPKDVPCIPCIPMGCMGCKDGFGISLNGPCPKPVLLDGPYSTGVSLNGSALPRTGLAASNNLPAVFGLLAVTVPFPMFMEMTVTE